MSLKEPLLLGKKDTSIPHEADQIDCLAEKIVFSSQTVIDQIKVQEGNGEKALMVMARATSIIILQLQESCVTSKNIVYDKYVREVLPMIYSVTKDEYERK